MHIVNPNTKINYYVILCHFTMLWSASVCDFKDLHWNIKLSTFYVCKKEEFYYDIFVCCLCIEFSIWHLAVISILRSKCLFIKFWNATISWFWFSLVTHSSRNNAQNWWYMLPISITLTSNKKQKPRLKWVTKITLV